LKYIERFVLSFRQYRMLAIGDELHYSHWDICNSCHDLLCKRQGTLVLPMSDRVYFVDTCDDKTPKIKKIGMPDVS